ncbi:MAG: hypothetical protein ACR2IE_09995 [Candidatus Sumerlaeaceae bacterium]
MEQMKEGFMPFGIAFEAEQKAFKEGKPTSDVAGFVSVEDMDLHNTYPIALVHPFKLHDAMEKHNVPKHVADDILNCFYVSYHLPTNSPGK